MGIAGSIVRMCVNYDYDYMISHTESKQKRTKVDYHKVVLYHCHNGYPILHTL